MIGAKLAHYKITSHLGSGGMGEVYQATDAKLGRSVAIKLLPEAFTNDVERSALFDREARVLASLNHANIAQIYGVEEFSNRKFLIMELVSGETLAEKIKRGALPVEEAFGIAIQILEALEAAHDQGLVHRDLKPANIKVTAEGRVKLLDFGLAKAFEAQTGSVNLSNTPEITLMATQPGLIVGTAPYMSPEQARGKEVDRRTDIFAFGAVLYEMLTGHRAFGGDDVSEVLSDVLRSDPNWTLLPADVPPAIQKLLKLCLQKEVKKRRQTATDVRIDFELAVMESAAVSPPPATISRTSRLLPWVGLGVVAAAAIILGALNFYREPEARPLIRLSVDLGPDAISGSRMTVAISPDGKRIAFPVRGPNGNPQLATRLLSQATPTVLPGTENAVDPFFSADNEWIGFSADSKLKKISVLGGSVVVLCDAPAMRGATWGGDGNIIAALNTLGGLSKVSDAGGTPQPLTTPAAGEPSHRWPQILPGGKAVLFTVSGNTSHDAASIQAVSLETGKAKTLVEGGYFGRYLNGQLIYLQQSVLFGVPFDVEKLEPRGMAAPLLDDVASDPATGGGQFDSSEDGTFVYRSGKSVAGASPVVWLDSSGKTQTLLARAGIYYTPRVSPEGHRLALSIDAGKGSDIYAYDIDRDALLRLTFDGKGNRWPLWTADGKYIIYASATERSIFWIRADGAGQPQRLLASKNTLVPASISPNGRLLAYTDAASTTESWMLPLNLTDPEHPKAGMPELFLASGGEPVFSPDGRWIAYTSDESGRYEVYVRPFQNSAGGRWQISMGGGAYSFWSGDGRQLYFKSPDNQIMVADYTVKGESFEAGKPRIWSPTPIRQSTPGLPALDLAPDGKRFAVLPKSETTAETGPVRVTFLLNFLSSR